MEGAYAGKVKLGMLYNGLKGNPMTFNKVIEFGFEGLEED